MNDLPIKTKNNWISNIINKVKSFLFKRKKEDTIIKEENEIIKQSEIFTDNFLNEIKVADFNFDKKEYDKDTLIKEIVSNVKILESFSNEKLEIILKYLQDENKRKREILAKNGQ